MRDSNSITKSEMSEAEELDFYNHRNRTPANIFDLDNDEEITKIRETRREISQKLDKDPDFRKSYLEEQKNKSEVDELIEKIQNFRYSEELDIDVPSLAEVDEKNGDKKDKNKKDKIHINIKKIENIYIKIIT